MKGKIKKGSVVKSLDEGFVKGSLHNGIGVVTGYLPEHQIFSVHYGGDRWITYHDHTEEQFLNRVRLATKEEVCSTCLNKGKEAICAGCAEE